MKKFIKIFISLLMACTTYGCGCSHDWEITSKLDPTCNTSGKTVYTCTKCGETKEENYEALGHDWVDATCTEPKTCSRCGTTDGSALGHEVTSGVCPRCGENVSYTLGDVFDFDGYTVSIGNNYSFDTISNRFSDYNGSTVIKLPITVQNNTGETGSFNYFYIDYFGSNGTEVDSFNYYFDDCIFDLGEARNGATQTGYMYFLYDGNGTYTIEFDNWTEHVEVGFDVTK